jgi:hypothetical protein
MRIARPGGDHQCTGGQYSPDFAGRIVDSPRHVGNSCWKRRCRSWPILSITGPCGAHHRNMPPVLRMRRGDFRSTRMAGRPRVRRRAGSGLDAGRHVARGPVPDARRLAPSHTRGACYRCIWTNYPISGPAGYPGPARTRTQISNAAGVLGEGLDADGIDLDPSTPGSASTAILSPRPRASTTRSRA